MFFSFLVCYFVCFTSVVSKLPWALPVAVTFLQSALGCQLDGFSLLTVVEGLCQLLAARDGVASPPQEVSSSH